MRRLWVYAISFLMTGLAVGGTFFFFTKGPSEDHEVQADSNPVASTPQNSVSVPTGPLVDKFNFAKQLKLDGEYTRAQVALEELLPQIDSSPLKEEIEKELWDTNIHLLFLGVVEGWTEEVTVQKGDSLHLIAKRHHTTPEFIADANHLEHDVLHPGQTLHVLTGKVSLFASKSLNTLTLKINDEVVKIYSVATGKDGCTPVGDFKIINRIVNPPWHHEGQVIPYGDPANILGTRWMGFDKKGYGIHGTADPDSVGKQASAGCLRMRNEEVEELFKIVPVGTMVNVVE